MAVNKNFVVKNGIEVNTSLILANADTNKVGIGTTVPGYVLHVNGGIGATDVLVSGFTTLTQDLQVGTSGSIFYVSDSSNAVGVGTSVPAWPLDVRSNASVGTTALYVYGDARITGDFDVSGDITYDEASGRNLDISGIATIATLYAAAGIITASNVHVSAATTTKDLLVTGVSTFEGLVYAASNVGVGTTNPTAAADVNNTTILNAGIVTANYFYGDISGATGVSTTFTGSIGIQSGGTVIGTGITMLNITGGGSTAWSSSNVATIKLPPAGVSIGLAIALGS